METSDIIGLVITIIVGLGLIGLSVPLLMGRCAGLIAGYSTMTKEERKTWDVSALAKFTGRILLIIGLLTLVLMPVMCLCEIPWLTWVYSLAVIGLGVFAAVWCNTGNRFRK
ncbi:DUF3784 domain-containing protein [Acutalibacter muris]|uniref:DUF3784 domain-containing protein n=1 Tax=Acutalibacter muris TaxID=1796620 RepID=A0A1Z2XNC5_9FIRM|nr:DUF3784 domain-containing protein [Acutalibacter muris]ANU53381.1 hypothetical protein A4V00_04660 [Hungateiclostridiaceae bacterium KB18]ASB39946.1 hypothetical protein ADH66_04330 [Acutalibacter muris]QQR29235.1 DUF3784 domain-containing protein [Acutalibacter muris]